ncbi:uncharacterized protein LOC127846266 [Dreissena polymorpha]|uniref:uncharacterized protein LOC127846266 n=1 Tax=Dreissena polymorpha TaxID=45954 RepID=UPI00226404BF|nr:uncharacterized protein LOC127846266 [Dreissena polymorpha]
MNREGSGVVPLPSNGKKVVTITVAYISQDGSGIELSPIAALVCEELTNETITLTSSAVSSTSTPPSLSTTKPEHCVMGGPEEDVAPSFTTIYSNGKTVEGFDPFNREEGLKELTLDNNDMAVVMIDITPIELNELHIHTFDTVLSVNVTYEDNTIQTKTRPFLVLETAEDTVVVVSHPRNGKNVVTITVTIESLDGADIMLSPITALLCGEKFTTASITTPCTTQQPSTTKSGL